MRHSVKELFSFRHCEARQRRSNPGLRPISGLLRSASPPRNDSGQGVSVRSDKDTRMSGIAKKNARTVSRGRTSWKARALVLPAERHLIEALRPEALRRARDRAA